MSNHSGKTESEITTIHNIHNDKESNIIKIKDSFDLLFQSVIDLMNDYLLEKKEKISGGESNSSSSNNSLQNPFYYEYLKKNQIIDVVYKNVLRFIVKLRFELSTVVVSFIYLDEVFKNNKDLLDVNSLEMLLLSSLILAQKYNEDRFYSEEIYYHTAKITMRKCNLIQFYFCNTINFNFFVKNKTFGKYCEYLQC